ncbi:conserved hypothetical protein [Pyrobaculum islandicum DSM 4184]|uniref:Uncharacterized protein n=1 Tax=Pyrobaculum islandicum (strain DSM 4184 / JCM 9189 / GEO3) TaxID=384616 RepID=A1RTY4_PYRIL|nr:hypothetical protein [Pyrobaculum islandicum]ABL88416.1 conserved hypothetical protein [Pyrobaculum islandicum DSM 4184]
MRWTPLLLLAALAMAANMTVITTPSGNIHITYIDNGTQIIVNINNYRVITANIKANVTIAGEQYYLHIVGQAKGQFTNATISQLLALLNQTRQGKIDSLIQVFKLLVDSNQTEKLKAKAMLTAASLNKTAPNATYLKMRLEYELEKKLSKFNKTLTKEDEWEIKLMTKDLNKTAALLSAIAARLEKYNISDAKTLLYIAQRLKELSTSVKKLEMYINGTKVEIKFDKNYYKIEIEKEDGKHKSDNKSRDKDEEAKDEKKSNKSDNSDEKDEKSGERDKKNEKERDDEKSRKEESNKKKGK